MPNPPPLEGRESNSALIPLVQKATMGFASGMMVGGVMGLVGGGVLGFKAGMRGTTLTKQMGQAALSSGAAFGFFLSIGSVMRS